MAEQPRKILVVCPDLFFSQRIESTAQALGYKAFAVDSPEAFDAVLRDGPPDIAVVDFSSPVPLWHAAIRRLAENGSTKILAFGPHMQAEAWKTAQALGATRVVANSKLVAELPDLLRTL